MTAQRVEQDTGSIPGGNGSRPEKPKIIFRCRHEDMQGVLNAAGIKTSSAILVAYVLAFYLNDQRRVFPSKETIQARSGLSESTVERALTELEARGVLTVLTPGGGRKRPTVYHVATVQEIGKGVTVTPYQEGEQEQKGGHHDPVSSPEKGSNGSQKRGQTSTKKGVTTTPEPGSTGVGKSPVSKSEGIGTPVEPGEASRTSLRGKSRNPGDSVLLRRTESADPVELFVSWVRVGFGEGEYVPTVVDRNTLKSMAREDANYLESHAHLIAEVLVSLRRKHPWAPKEWERDNAHVGTARDRITGILAWKQLHGVRPTVVPLTAEGKAAWNRAEVARENFQREWQEQQQVEASHDDDDDDGLWPDADQRLADAGYDNQGVDLEVEEEPEPLRGASGVEEALKIAEGLGFSFRRLGRRGGAAVTAGVDAF